MRREQLLTWLQRVVECWGDPEEGAPQVRADQPAIPADETRTASDEHSAQPSPGSGETPDQSPLVEDKFVVTTISSNDQPFWCRS